VLKFPRSALKQRILECYLNWCLFRLRSADYRELDVTYFIDKIYYL